MTRNQSNMQSEETHGTPPEKHIEQLVYDLQELGFDTVASNDIGYDARFFQIGESREYGDEKRGIRVSRAESGFTVVEIDSTAS